MCNQYQDLAVGRIDSILDINRSESGNVHPFVPKGSGSQAEEFDGDVGCSNMPKLNGDVGCFGGPQLNEFYLFVQKSSEGQIEKSTSTTVPKGSGSTRLYVDAGWSNMFHPGCGAGSIQCPGVVYGGLMSNSHHEEGASSVQGSLAPLVDKSAHCSSSGLVKEDIEACGNPVGEHVGTAKVALRHSGDLHKPRLIVTM